MSRKIKTQEFFRKLHQKKFMRVITYSLFVAGLPLFGAYAHFIEPNRIKISQIKIPIHKLPKAFHHFRIIQISDLHYGPTNKSENFFQKCIRKINELKPDLVALTGDYMQWDSLHANPLAKILSALRAPFGVFASLGNHDYGVCHKGRPPTDDVNHLEVTSAFEAHGIKILHNEHVEIVKENHKLHVVGLGDYWTEHFKPEVAFAAQKNKDITTILLSHNPDSIDHLQDYSFDLMLAGHVHGGQISFPWIGPLSVPIKNKHLRRGLHSIFNRWLYVNRGLGHIFKARFNSPPEIAVLELIPA